MIETKFLSKTDDTKTRLNQVNLRLVSGTFYAILGNKGSGKTTLLHLLSGMEEASEGEVNINGFDLKNDPLKAKNLFGIYTTDEIFPKDTTVKEFLTALNAIRKTPYEKSTRQICSLLESFGLTTLSSKLIKNLTADEKNLLGILQTALGKSVISFVDDFPDRMESENPKILFDVLRDVFAEKTFIFATESPEYAKFADVVLLISDGEIISEIPSEKLIVLTDSNGKVTVNITDENESVAETEDTEE